MIPGDAVRERPRISVVVPVYNTVRTLPVLCDRLESVLGGTMRVPYEVVLVDDGSRNPATWPKLLELKEARAELRVYRLARNYGQHSAVLCGFAESRGDFVITLDDDLQNPPEEIPKLYQAIMESGADAVFGVFEKKKHPFYRRIGTRIIDRLNSAIFQKPADLVLSNYRIIARGTVDRLVRHKTAFPYIPGLILLYGSTFANTTVRHEARADGESSYGLRQILTLCARLLFNYSSFPIRFICGVGLAVAGVSFLFGMAIIVRVVLEGTSVPGWPTIAVLTSFFNGLLLLMVAILGEYIARLNTTISWPMAYSIRDSRP